MRGLRKEVLKKIHPDLFALAPKALQQANLSCVQNLNEFWSLITLLLPALQHGTLTPQLSVPHIKPKYDFVCYVHQDSSQQSQSKNEDDKFLQVTCRITIPHMLFASLSQRKAMPREAMGAAAVDLIDQQRDFLRDLGVEDPFEVKQEQKANSKSVAADVHAPIDQFVYDTIAAEKHRKRLTEYFQSTLLNVSTKPKSRYAQSQGWHPNAKVQHGAEAMAESYLHSERVQLQRVNAIAEAALMNKLLSFFSEYGRFLNFPSHIWRRIILVVDGAADGEAYAMRKQEGHTIITLPGKFKKKRLADFLHESVPATLPGLY